MTTWAHLLGWGSSGNPFEGGTGAGDTMPWDGLNYQLNLLQPFQTLYDSLTQTPATDGIGWHRYRFLLASRMSCTPSRTSRPASSSTSTPTPQAAPPARRCATYPRMSRSRGWLRTSPTGPVATRCSQTWVTDYAINPTLVNEPTQDQINNSIALLQTGSYNFSPTELAQVDAGAGQNQPRTAVPVHQRRDHHRPQLLGLCVGSHDDHAGLVGEFGGYDPWLGGDRLPDMCWKRPAATRSTRRCRRTSNCCSPTSPSPATRRPFRPCWTAERSQQPRRQTPGAAVDPSALDPTFTADLSTLLASLGTTVGSDAVSAALAEISAQITADFASFVPQSLLSLF